MIPRLGNGPSSDPFWWSLHQADLVNAQARADAMHKAHKGPPTWKLLGMSPPAYVAEERLARRKNRKRKALRRSA